MAYTVFVSNVKMWLMFMIW